MIITTVTLPDDDQMEAHDWLSEKVTGYFERDSYASPKMDEMFYVVENRADQIIEASEIYFIQKCVEDEWKTLNNNSINHIDKIVRIFPEESTEYIFWLSMNSTGLDEGTYRLSTRVTFLEESEDIGDGELANLFIPFEINE